MENTFYRPTKLDSTEFEKIVRKMREDLVELVAGKVSDQEAKNYVEKLMADAKPLPRDQEIVFWGLDEPENMPGDARVDYFYTPTYLAVSIMANVLLNRTNEVSQLMGFTETLKKGLLAATGRKFQGHGYDSNQGLVNCLEIFATADMFTFLRVYPELCPKFTQQFYMAIEFLDKISSTEQDENSWDRFNPEQAALVLQKFRSNDAKTVVFVYGTLLRGNNNHDHYLGHSRFLGDAVLPGYALYDLGNYPGVKMSEANSVKGELYNVDAPTLERLNRLEGEGSLYELKSETVEMNGRIVSDVGVYVYLHEVSEQNFVSFAAQPWRG